MRINEVEKELQRAPRRWLVTGAARFIGSHLTERLLRLGQEVVGLDNFATGHQHGWTTSSAGSVPRQRSASASSKATSGTRTSATAPARASSGSSTRPPSAPSHAPSPTRWFVYASSSSVYGDEPNLPKVEGREGRLLSRYAATKMVNEIYEGTFQDAYGIETVGLRYFNVFGPRQDPNGPYAAVIPRWVLGLRRGEPCEIYGDGQTNRDLCYVDNAVQANLLAAMAGDPVATNRAYNVACADYTTLNELFEILREEASAFRSEARGTGAVYKDFRKGDVRQSLADIGGAAQRLGYESTHMVREGLGLTVGWYAEAVREGRLFAA